MAELGDTALTFADWAKRKDPDGNTAEIVELLSDTNPILEDAVVLEGNLPTGHRTTMRSGLPTVTWRKFNQGVQPSKSTTVQVDDQAGMLEAYAETDKSIADLNGNTAEFRLSEERPFLESMNQEVAATLFYGDTSLAPNEFMGLAPRYSSLSAENGGNIVDGGGTGSDNTSIWMIIWGKESCHLFFPKGQKAGLNHDDKGQETLEDSNGNKYEGYRSHYKWDVGLSLRDWRQVVRIANIDVSDLATAGESGYSGPDLPLLMITGYNKLENPMMGKLIVYCNRTVKAALDKIASTKSNVNLSISEFEGKPSTSFYGAPIHVVDAILDTETQVT
ncbi:MAG: major capsid protein [Alphaproteobacteria bacterium]